MNGEFAASLKGKRQPQGDAGKALQTSVYIL